MIERLPANVMLQRQQVTIDSPRNWSLATQVQRTARDGVPEVRLVARTSLPV